FLREFGEGESSDAEARGVSSSRKRPRSILARDGTTGSSFGLTSISSRAIKAMRPAEFSPTSIYLFLSLFVRRFYVQTDFFRVNAVCCVSHTRNPRRFLCHPVSYPRHPEPRSEACRAENVRDLLHICCAGATIELHCISRARSLYPRSSVIIGADPRLLLLTSACFCPRAQLCPPPTHPLSQTPAQCP